MRLMQVFIGLTGCASVALGAISSHGVADPVEAAALERAATYGLLHAGVLLALLNWPGRMAQFTRFVFVSGLTLFTGSIALKYLADLTAAGQAAPAGGMLLMLGWLLLLKARTHSKLPA